MNKKTLSKYMIMLGKILALLSVALVFLKIVPYNSIIQLSLLFIGIILIYIGKNLNNKDK